MTIILRRGFHVITIFFATIGVILVGGYFAVRFGFTNTEGIIDNQTKKFIPNASVGTKTYTEFPLAHTPEWISFRQAVAKDLPMITKVSKETGVPARLLVAILVPEQMRLFHSNRSVFKSVFEPLKVLGSQSQFSWGIFGIKDDTAKNVEMHLKTPSSPYYLGETYENALNFSSLSASSTDIDQERYLRITDEHNHLYGYRYAALYILQIESQWKKAGFPIDKKPEVIATLWNLGFEKSKPHKDPTSGGAVLDINDTKYSFGEIARLFYYSDEMIEIFPQE
jgi:hypothetical protein